MDSVEYVKTNPLVGLDISSLPAPTKAPVIGNFRGVKQAQLEANQESDRVGGAQIEYQTATASVSRATQMLNSAKAEQTALQGQLQSAQAQLQSAQQELANAQTQAQAIQGQIAQAQADFTRRQEEARAQAEAQTQPTAQVAPTKEFSSYNITPQTSGSPQPYKAAEAFKSYKTAPQVDLRLVKALADQALEMEAKNAQAMSDKENTARNEFVSKNQTQIASYGGNAGDLDKVLQQANPAILPAAQALKAEFDKERIWLQSNKASSNGSPFRNNIMNLEKNLQASIASEQSVASKKALTEWNNNLGTWRTENTVKQQSQPVAPVAAVPTYGMADISTIYRESPEKAKVMVSKILPQYSNIFPMDVFTQTYGGQSINPFGTNAYGVAGIKKPEGYELLNGMSPQDLYNLSTSISNQGYKLFDNNAFELGGKKFTNSDIRRALAVKIYEINQTPV